MVVTTPCIYLLSSVLIWMSKRCVELWLGWRSENQGNIGSSNNIWLVAAVSGYIYKSHLLSRTHTNTPVLGPINMLGIGNRRQYLNVSLYPYYLWRSAASNWS